VYLILQQTVAVAKNWFGYCDKYMKAGLRRYRKVAVAKNWFGYCDGTVTIGLLRPVAGQRQLQWLKIGLGTVTMDGGLRNHSKVSCSG